MATGLDISTQFIRDVVLPLFQRELRDDYARLAVAIVGTGSDVLGLDDQISRDHHWGPRANVMVLPGDKERLLPKVADILNRKLPRTYQGFNVPLELTAMTGVCCCAIDDFQTYFLGTDKLPQCELDWLRLCEVDLFHLTGGRVVYDGPGELSRIRETLAYYPENIWKKRLADWCMYITGRDAPYNVNRVARRNDLLTARIYEALFCREVMEICFTLNKRYAPYTKWLNRLVRMLPTYGSHVAPMLDRILEEPDLQGKVRQMIEVNYVIAGALYELGLTPKPRRREFDPGLTDLTLYDSAWHIYRTLPPEYLEPSFHRTELWERLAREVLFNTDDYFQKNYESASR